MKEERVSLSYIFWTFLKLGATAFGGYMALIALVQRQLVERDQRLREEDVLDGVSLVSVLPGPVAVNVIVYIGYRLRGTVGALLALVGIVLPSFLLVLLLAWAYVRYGHVPAVRSFFQGIAPAVTALIFTVGVNMAQKTLKTPVQGGVAVAALCLLAGVGGVWSTFAVILGSGVLGALMYFRSRSDAGTVGENPATEATSRWSPLGGLAVVLVLLVAVLLFLLPAGISLPLQLVATFAGTSLTLFGGGYVVIPTLHELFVTNLGWLTPSEFSDGIAIGQVTPGPIFITATFIGYKVAGTLGAVLATVAMFLPPALLTVFLSRCVEAVKGSSVVKSAMTCIRAAVIGMIFASVYTIGKTMEPHWATGLLLVAVIVLSFRKWSPIGLLVGSGLAGLFLF